MSRILQRIEAVAKAKPDAIALRSGETCLSYRELIDLHAVSARLRALRTHSLGIYLDNGIEWIVFDLAALDAGIRIVPLPWFFSNAQIGHAIDAGAVDLIAYERRLPRGIAGSGAPIRGYRGACLQAVAGKSAASFEKRSGAKLALPRAAPVRQKASNSRRPSWKRPVTRYASPLRAMRSTFTWPSCLTRPCWKTSPGFMYRWCSARP